MTSTGVSHIPSKELILLARWAALAPFVQMPAIFDLHAENILYYSTYVKII